MKKDGPMSKESWEPVGEVKRVKLDRTDDLTSKQPFLNGRGVDYVNDGDELYTARELKDVAELLDRAILEMDWEVVQSVLSYLKEITGYEGDWKSDESSDEGNKTDAEGDME